MLASGSPALLATRQSRATGLARTRTTAATGTLALVALEGVCHALGALFEGLFVGFEETHGLVGQGDDLGLQTRELDALAEDDSAVDLVEGRGEFLVRDHTADDGGDLLLGELEHAAQGGDGQAVVEGGVGEEVGAEAFFLDLRGEHLLDLVRLRHQVPDLDAVQHAGGLLPVARGEELGGHDNAVTGVLGGTREDLALVVVEHATEGLGDDTAFHFGRGRGLGHERHFKEHAGGEVDALEKLEVDVHVEWELTLAFEALLFGGNDLVALKDDALGQQLLLSSAAADLRESGLGFVDEAGSEGTQTNLDKGAVKQNLGVDVEVGDVLR